MEITDVRVYHNEKESKILASASITFDSKLVVRGIKVMYSTKNNSLFASMPSYKKQDGTYSDYVFSLDSTLRNEINDKVIAQYNNTKPREEATQTYQGQYKAPIEPPQKNERQEAYDSIDVTEDDLPF
jgi:DNA-binding cell septation regulator SpoVG